LLVVVSLAAPIGPGAQAGGKPIPFTAIGVITDITPGDVDEAGNSGRFVVKGRTVSGTLTGSLAGPFTFTFGTNVPITQAGQIHGVLEVGGQEMRVHATSQFGPAGIPCPGPPEVTGVPCAPLPGGGAVALGILLNGTWTLTAGAQGHGNLTGVLVPRLDAAGHIVGVFSGEFRLNGQWHP
jgi:hypothetical protein